MDEINTVRNRLHEMMNRRDLRASDVAACIKKRSGERYSTLTIRHYLADDDPVARWERMTEAVCRAWPRVGDGIVCDSCGRLKLTD